MKCKRCNTFLADEFTYYTPDTVRTPVFTNKSESYYLCNECAKELLMDSQSAREGDE